MNRLQSSQASKTIGANEDMFLKAFETTPKLNIATQKKLENELARCIGIISNPNADWDQRVQAMKLFRSLVNSGILDNEEYFISTLKCLEIPFQNNICDLRSQVVRETCITIAFLSCRLQQKFSRMAEMLLPSLIKLIPNSAKIVSTSALVALRFIIQSTQNSRLIAIIKYQLSTSKSKEIHRALCEIAERIVTIWSPSTIEKNMTDFQEVLRLGICDSDEQARQYSRRAFNVFAEHFREQADKLYNSLDQQRQRVLNNLNHGGGSTLSMNGYGSATSGLNTMGLTSYIPQHATTMAAPSNHLHHQAAPNNNHGPPSIPTSRAGAHQLHNRFGHSYQSSPSSGYGQSATTTITNSVASSHIVSRLKSSLMSSNGNSSTAANCSIPKMSPTGHCISASPSKIRTPTARSTSAIDVDAQQRARARAVYLSSMYHRPRQLAGDLTPSPAKSNLPQPTSKLTPLAAASAPAPSSVAAVAATQPTTLNPQDGSALSKAASYLSSVINDTNIAESQIVTTVKYFNSLIDKNPSEIISKLLSELMPPLVIGMDNAAISVRKASVFAIVSIYAKVGFQEMETYLTSLTTTQKKLLEVYIKKHDEELARSKQAAGESLDSKNFSASMTSSNSSYR